MNDTYNTTPNTTTPAPATDAILASFAGVLWAALEPHIKGIVNNVVQNEIERLYSNASARLSLLERVANKTEERLESLDGGVSETLGYISNHAKLINDAETKINDIKTAISGVKPMLERLAHIENVFSSHASNISSHASSLGILIRRIDALETHDEGGSVDISALSAKVEALRGDVDEALEDLKNINGLELDKMERRLSKVEQDVGEINDGSSLDDQLLHSTWSMIVRESDLMDAIVESERFGEAVKGALEDAPITLSAVSATIRVKDSD